MLASSDSPFAESARQLLAGQITLAEYREAQRSLGQKMVDENRAAFEEVLPYLQALAQDPTLHFSSNIPPIGRMKAPGDIAPKLARRGAEDMNFITDIAGTRVVVRSNADVEAVVAKIQEKYKVREVYTKGGEMETDLMTPEQVQAQGLEVKEDEVWVDAKLDQDDIHRLVEGHPASGYRALHVVVEVNGKPVEIQIKTEAMHEWGELEHKLVYKNNQLPEADLKLIKNYTKQTADYLAKVSHGEDPGQRPDLPNLRSDLPNRPDIQANLRKMEALMDKYSRPSEVRKVAPAGQSVPPPLLELNGKDAAEATKFKEAYQKYLPHITQQSSLNLPDPVKSIIRALVKRSNKDGNEHEFFAIQLGQGPVVESSEFVTSGHPFTVNNKSGEKDAIVGLLRSMTKYNSRGSNDVPLVIYSYHSHPRRGKVHADGRPYTETHSVDGEMWDAQAALLVSQLREMGYTGPIKFVAGAVPAQSGSTKMPYIATYTRDFPS